MLYIEKIRNHISIFLALIFTFLILTVPSWAEEKGTWSAHAVLVTTNGKTLKIGDKEDHLIFFSEHEGVIFNNEKNGSFLDKARYQVAYLGDTAGMVNGGYKTFTMADGSQVFAKYQVTEATPPVFKGKWEFIGGTGKYKGITGAGVYTLNMLSDTTAWDALEGDYKIP